MPQIIDIPKVGQVEFPDEMSDADVSTAAAKLHKDALIKEHTKNLKAEQSFEGIGGPKQAISQGRFIGPPPPRTVTEALGRELRGFGQGTVNLVKDIGQTVLSASQPGAIAQAELQRQEEISKRPPSIASDFERIPLLGPAVIGLGQDIQKFISGPPGAAGEVLARQGIPLLVGAGLGKAARGAKTAARFEPEGAVNDVVKSLNVKGTGGAPGAKIAPEIEYIREAHPEIHHELVNKGAVFDKVDRRGYAQAAQRAKKNFWSETTGEDLKKFGHNQEPTTPVADSIYNSIGEITQEANTTLRDAIKARAKIYDGKTKTLNAIHERIKELRKTRESLNNPLTRAEILNTPEMAANMRELEGLQKVFNDRMSRLSGKDYSKINFRYKALTNVEEMARDAAGAGETAKAAELATRHKVAETILNAPGLYEAGTKLTKQALSKVIRDPNDPDLLISQSLKKLGGKSRRIAIEPSALPHQLQLPPAPPSGPSSIPTPTGTSIIKPEFNQTMKQYLDLNNLTPEAQRFLGYPPKE